MKRALSLILAFAITCCLPMTAFADAFMSDTEETRSDRDTRRIPDAAGLTGAAGSGLVLIYEAKDETDSFLEGATLQPGAEYTVAIGEWVTRDGSAAAVFQPLTRARAMALLQENGINITKENDVNVKVYERKGGSAITSANVSTRNTGTGAEKQLQYAIDLKTKSYWGTKLTEVQLDVIIYKNRAASSKKIDALNGGATFDVGWKEVDRDQFMNTYDEGDVVTIDVNSPVFGSRLLRDISSTNRSRPVTFEGDGWQYTNRVPTSGDVNFHYSHDPIHDIAKKFPNYDMKFLTFSSGINFRSEGDMEIDVSDISDVFDGEFNVYLYRDGKITAINSSFDATADTLRFKTDYLGGFIITNRLIDEAKQTLAPNTEEGSNLNDTIINDTNDGNIDIIQPYADDEAGNVPETGRAPVADAAAAAIFLSLAGAILFGNNRVDRK